ncbi:glycosyltransferase [Mixta theicola]|uniref:Glycosyltransferase n=1 Tax=Mixta theicola TaxID=1458355 RepID=A0A2K1Q6V5_9GAMM|nr:glycosyltransferase [Mixta theicola]PNS10776.1 glycosyltransferase [Mixta theicola]GLR08856.1 glycosyl transferase [Mixta theicola]
MTQARQKILLLDNGREWGGGTNSMLELLKRIDRDRFDITCCFYYNYQRGEGETIESVLNAIGIPVIFIPQRKQPASAKLQKELLRSLLFFSRSLKKRAADIIDRRWRVEPNARRLRELLLQGAYDTLYMNNQPSTNVEGYLAVADMTVGLVQHCRIEPLLTPRLVRMINQRVNAVIAVSHGVCQTLRSSGVEASRCFTVSNAIDIHQPLPDRATVRARLGLPEDRFLFGSIGSLIARKATHHTLQALSAFQQACPQVNWHMVVVGAGPELNSLQQLAAREGIADRVTFTGFRNNALDYLAAMDVFVLASKSEGLPRVVLEAMLVNTAVIGSNVVGTAELVDDGQTGLLFEYGDTARLCAHMQALCQNNALRQQLISQANANVKAHYAIENYVAGVEALLQSVAKEPSSHA